jgi:uncharacterized protein with HEPN domain
MSRHEFRARYYLTHMMQAVDRIQKFTRGRATAEFLSDELLQDGVIRNFEILGEASKNLLVSAPELAQRFPGIPFAAIYGMRNQLSHGYFGVDLDTVWKVIERDLPDLRREIEAAIADLDLSYN